MVDNAQEPRAASREEAERLYRAVFRGPAPETVIDRFLPASVRLDEGADPPDRAAYGRALERVNDLEALEVAGRYRRRIPLLSAKMRVMVYIAETVPENQRYFIKRRDDVAGAVWALIAGGVRTAYKLAKGLALLARVDHA